MALSQINYANLYGQSWDNIYTIINNKTNVSDPTLSSAEFRKWIYSRFPDVKSNDFAGYPFIVINPPTIQFNDSNNKGSLDMKSKFITWTISIEVYTSDRAYNSNGQDGNGFTYQKSITNNLLKTFNDVTIRNSLKSTSINFAKIDITGNDIADLDNERIYTQTFELTFKTKIQTSV